MQRTHDLPQRLACVAIACALAGVNSSAQQRPETTPPESVQRATAIKALQPLGTLIGEWKGVAQPRRGSNSGAWSEKAKAAWDFRNESAHLVVNFDPGQQFQAASWSLNEDGKTLQLRLVPLKGDSLQLTGSESTESADSTAGTWVFESEPGTFPRARCTLRVISEIRVTLLFEEQKTEMASFRRLSEIGMTRAGARLASGNTGERQCVVTGGLGTIKVTHEGKSYYVCCEGCRQAFEEDPAGTLEAYRERLKESP